MALTTETKHKHRSDDGHHGYHDSCALINIKSLGTPDWFQACLFTVYIYIGHWIPPSAPPK